jgi:F-type H+-transporting ATPase subunit b
MHLDGWTLLLQSINLLALLALLRWLFYRPLMRVIDARRAVATEALQHAEAAKQAADERMQALAGERAAFEASRDALLQAARDQAAREREASQRAATAQAAATLDAARQRIAGERQEALRALFDDASELACNLAERLLRSIEPGSGAQIDAAAVDALAARTAATPPGEREAWFAPAAPRGVVVASARPLADDDRRCAEQALQAALGADVAVSFDVDPALMAGAELRFAHGVLALHWAGELAAARQSLAPAPQEPST